MKNEPEDQLQAERADSSKNQQLYGASKNKDVQNPEQQGNSQDHSPDTEIDTTKASWHHNDKQQNEDEKASLPNHPEDDDCRTSKE